MASPASFLIRQFLEWVARRPRSHAELREAWSSTCPLTCAWEDALADDLVGYGADGTLVLTARGQALLGASPAPSLDHAQRESMVPRAMPAAVRQLARPPVRPSRGDRL